MEGWETLDGDMEEWESQELDLGLGWGGSLILYQAWLSLFIDLMNNRAPVAV